MVTDKLRRIKVLLLDVDGVLTDGGIIYSDTGSEFKVFSVKDGLGIAMLREAGIEVGIVTGRTSKALYQECLPPLSQPPCHRESAGRSFPA